MPSVASPTRPRATVILFAIGGLLAVGCAEQTVDPGDPGSVPPEYATAASCGECHPDQLAEWETSMHAYSGLDPLMHKLSAIAEVEGGQDLGGSCKKCHAPAQRRLDLLAAAGVTTTQSNLDEDGLNCDVCHSISVVPPTGSIDFLENVDPTGPKYANLDDPVPTSAHANEKRSWYSTSQACAPCHQVDLPDGNGLENTFIEWEVTLLPGMGIECQSCHMPRYTGQAAVGGPIRDNLHRHKMVGVDYAYDAFRGIDLDQQKADIRELLENSVTVNAVVPASVLPNDDLEIAITVLNDKTGHSIPSGVSFAREMWIEVIVRDGDGTELYHSGALQDGGDLPTVAQDPDLELFTAQMYDADGAPTGFAWRAESIDESGLLPYLASRTGGWTVNVPGGTPEPLEVSLALRFRPIPPATMRELDLERLLPVEIFDMWTETTTVSIGP